MTKVDENIQTAQNMLSWIVERCYQLEEENKKLKEENEEYKKMFEDQLKESYIKNTAEFLDKKFPKVNWFMEEDTLQELRDIGKI